MSHSLSLSAGVVALAALVPPLANAQHARSVSGTAEQPADTRSPGAAAVLSFFYPGSGSYYAGNIGHGTRHAVIGITLSAAWGAGVVLSCSDGDCSDGAGDAVFFAGLGVVVAHRIWAIIDAVGDAHTYNQRGMRENGLDLRPVPVVLGHSEPGRAPAAARGAAGVGIRLARFEF